jgi:hypothetical protein
MSGGTSLSSVDFVAFSFEFDRVRRALFTLFLVRNWCGLRILGRKLLTARVCPMMDGTGTSQKAKRNQQLSHVSIGHVVPNAVLLHR